MYDAEGGCLGGTCPKFVLDEKARKVVLVDRRGHEAEMSIEHFNKFIDAVLSGELKRVG